MAFNVPNYTQIPQKPVVKPIAWVRPADWISITDTPNEVQFLVSSLGQGAYALVTTFNKPASENLYIDWGDGVITTVSTNTSTTSYHNYTTGGTACSLGYDTWKIRVYVDSGASITGCQVGTPQNALSLIYPSIASGLLEAYYGDGITIPNYDNYFFSNSNSTTPGGALNNFWNLQYVKLPSVVTGSTSLTQTFFFCYNLKQVVMPVSMSGLTGMISTFGFCQELTGTIIVPQDATGITSLAGTFQSCNMLTGIILPPTLSSCSVLQNFADAAYNLTSIVLPPLTSCSNFTNAFSSCASLLYIKIPAFATTPQTLQLNNMFQNCYSLQQIELPSTLTSGYENYLASCSNIFGNCSALQNITLPNNFNTSTILFTSCYNLITVNLPSTMTGLNTMSSMFNGCYNLQSVTLPPTISAATITLVNAFSSCFSLGSITIPSSYNISSLSSAFQNCFSLKNITLPNNAQNSCTTMVSMCSGCYSLETIVMPTSLNGVISLVSTFFNTANLSSVVFPSSMNACTTMAACFQNSGIQSVTLPTSMSVCTSFATTFSGNRKIKQITLPATVAIGNNFGSTFNYCPTLETVTLPTTQTISLTSLSNMFFNCPNITTINNISNLGYSSLTSGTVQDGTQFLTYSSSFTGSTSFVCRFTKLEINGISTAMSSCTGLRLSNTGGAQWGGTSPQINISYTNMSTAALNLLFADMAAQPAVTGKTINITGASGAAGLTAADRLVITSKGWTITG